jgi:branched-chain amino acid transport system ATP-binding protein
LASPEVTGPPVLTIDAINAGYRRRPVVYDVSMQVHAGEIVTVLGHNGAGKTTTIKTVFGLLRPMQGRVVYRDKDVSGANCARHVAMGMSYTPAERFVFPDLPVHVNLRLGALQEPSKAERDRRAAGVYELFPILEERKDQLAGTFSGGQQRILSVGMALMSDPKLMLLDEPSLGVSPMIVQQILAALRRMADEDGRAIVMLEQNVGHALREADRVYVMRSGRVILEESARTCASATTGGTCSDGGERARAARAARRRRRHQRRGRGAGHRAADRARCARALGARRGADRSRTPWHGALQRDLPAAQGRAQLRPAPTAATALSTDRP